MKMKKLLKWLGDHGIGYILAVIAGVVVWEAMSEPPPASPDYSEEFSTIQAQMQELMSAIDDLEIERDVIGTADSVGHHR